MAISEFDIIASYFNKPGLKPDNLQQQSIPLGIGDDCALINPPQGEQLAVSMDVLVADVHFPISADASLIAQRALAVNLSDLAAMGAAPLAFTLGLTLPDVDESWLARFSEGLSLSAQKYCCPLIGGDMSKGPLSIAIQVHGTVVPEKVLRRSGANIGDKVYVSGVLGEAGLALGLLDNSLTGLSEVGKAILSAAYYQPEPRLGLGYACGGIASAAIDISDGLLADLGHIAKQSQVSIALDAESIPLSSTVVKAVGVKRALEYALSAGDDYELAFTAAPKDAEALCLAAQQAGVKISCIGTVGVGSGVSCIDNAGQKIVVPKTGYNHFN